MSWKLTRQIWNRSPFGGSSLLVLQALADFADDDGVAFPSIPTLAKRAHLTDRQTQRVLRNLEQIGVVSVEPRAGQPRRGDHRHRNLYRIHVDKLTGDTSVTHEQTLTGDASVTLEDQATGDISSRSRVTSGVVTGDIQRPNTGAHPYCLKRQVETSSSERSERAREDRAPSPVRDMLDHFSNRHRDRFSVPAVFTSKDRAKMSKAIDAFCTNNYVDMASLIDAFFGTTDTWIINAGFSVGVFVGQIPGLISRQHAASVSETEAEDPAVAYITDALGLKGHDRHLWFDGATFRNDTLTFPTNTAAEFVSRNYLTRIEQIADRAIAVESRERA